MTRKTIPSEAKLREIVREIPTPFHLYDEAKLRQRARALTKAFAWNPGYTEFFAIKANPNPFLLKILQREGCGVDCASLTELMLADACGFPGDRIMFSSNTTPAGEYRYARALGANINLDDITHIDFLKQNGGIPEFVSMRVNPGGKFKLGNFVMGNPGDAKFGMTVDQVYQAADALRALGAKRFGLHAFLASNVLDESYYPTMARLLFELAIDLYKKVGVRIELINLSGGVGIPYRPTEDEPDIGRIGEGVREAYEALIAPSEIAPVRIVTELGRYISGPVGWLVTTAIHEKLTHKHYLGLDASAVDLMRPAMYGAYHHITVAGKENAPCDTLYDVVGSLCENNDKFAVDRMLPHVDMGDLVVIHDTGAHGHSMGYNYNGKLRSAEVLLCEDGSFKMIRRAQTPADYFSTLDFSGLFEGAFKK